MMTRLNKIEKHDIVKTILDEERTVTEWLLHGTLPTIIGITIAAVHEAAAGPSGPSKVVCGLYP